MSRRGFACAGAAALTGLTGWGWLVTRSEEDGLPWPFRRVLGLNERLARAAFRTSRMSPEFPRGAAREPRVNGPIGIDPDLDPSTWRLRVSGSSNEAGARLFRLEEIQALPRVEMTTELRCIEGWSTVVHWAGARLADLASVTGLATRGGGPLDRSESAGDLLGFVALETADGQYYVGLDMASALHPQTLLCYEMNGRPLTPEHGAPLRLAIPVKYGIKNLKQIGTIRFTDRRPADYWAERGYDWYAGH
jgi:DMSO/TMAO reductase YedYZ molybdopterin-dependent catalytic subunit